MNSLPSVRVDDILIHPRDRDLIIATHGRSIWIVDDISPLEQMKPHDRAHERGAVRSAAGGAVEERSFAVRVRLTNRDFKGQNPQGGTAIRIWAKADMPGAKIEFLQDNKVVSVIEPCSDTLKVGCVDIKTGMNSFQWNMQKPAPAGAGRGGGRNGGGGNAAGGAAATGGAAPTGGAAAGDVPVQFAGRGGQNNGRVPFVMGGRGGGGGGGGNAAGPVEPGSYMVRLTVGDKTFMSSVQVLEDIWMRPQ